MLFDVFKEGQAAEVRHADIRDDQVNMALLQKGKSLGSACRGTGCIAVFSQENAEKLPHAGFIVNNKYLGYLGHGLCSRLEVVF